jgi:hypothetical protein
MIHHRLWGGGLQTQQRVGVAGAQIVGLGVRDRAAADRPLLKRILVHEAVHQMQWEQDVQQDPTMEARIDASSKPTGSAARWAGSGILFAAPKRSGRTSLEPTPWTRTLCIPSSEIGTTGWRPLAERATIDSIRIGSVTGLAWWQMNVHIKKLLEELGIFGIDAERPVEWKKLGRSGKRRALADPVPAPKLRHTVGMPGSAFARAVGA